MDTPFCYVPRRLNPIHGAATTRRSAPPSQRVGVLVSRWYEGGPEVQADLTQCCHCQRIWPYIVGSGNVRGWCMSCGGMTCGPDCILVGYCVPSEQYLSNLERGLPIWHRDIAVSVPAQPPPAR